MWLSVYSVVYWKTIGISIIPPTVSKVTEVLPIPKLYCFGAIINVFSLELTADKNTDYIKKCVEWKLFRIQFPTKNSVGTYVLISSMSGGRGLIIFGIVISSEVLFENELKIHTFIVPLTCFSATITIIFYWHNEIYGMIFGCINIFISQLPMVAIDYSWIDANHHKFAKDE